MTISDFSDEEKKLFDYIAITSKEQQVNSYAIGGFVRDKLLHRPCKDIDIVCLGDGINFAKKVAEKIAPNIHVNYFKNFGTAMFSYKGIDVEFVGARKESYQQHSRKPFIEQGNLEDDQKRRDFTINALAVPLMNATYDTENIIDPFNGLSDLKKKIIRTPLNPDITFSDDPLRMLRAIRFATQLDFQIHLDTFHAIQKNTKRIRIVSMERITNELNKIILSPKPSIGFRLLLDTGLLALIFPEMYALKGVEIRQGITHKDNFYHTIQVLDNLSRHTNNLWLRWAAVLHDIAKPETKRFNEKVGWTFHGHEVRGAKKVPSIFKQFRLPLNDKMKYVKKLVYLHLRPISLTKENISDSAIRRLLFEAGDDIDDLMSLCEADITSKNKKRVATYLENFKLVREKLKSIEEKDHIRNFQPPITGEVIMHTFSIKPSFAVGQIKKEIKEAILDGKIKNNYTQAYNLMLEIGHSMGLTSNETKV